MHLSFYMFVLNTGKDRRPLKGHSIAKIWQGGHGLAEKRLKRITIWIKNVGISQRCHPLTRFNNYH